MATNINIKQVRSIDPISINPLTINPLTINPVTIRSIEKIEKIAPAAVHIKELNHIDPLSIESLRIDHVRNLDPVKIDQLDVTHLPTVALSLSQLPALDLNLRRVPPFAIALQQDFCLPSRYTMKAKVLGFKIMQMDIDGVTMMKPQDRTRREQSRTHERSFADVAPLGNPAIPTDVSEKSCEAVTRTVPAPGRAPGSLRGSARPILAERNCAPPVSHAPGHAPSPAHKTGLSVGSPHFHYSISGGSPATSSVGSGD